MEMEMNKEKVAAFKARHGIDDHVRLGPPKIGAAGSVVISLIERLDGAGIAGDQAIDIEKEWYGIPVTSVRVSSAEYAELFQGVEDEQPIGIDQWDAKFFSEYLKANDFRPYAKKRWGTPENMLAELESREENTP